MKTAGIGLRRGGVWVFEGAQKGGGGVVVMVTNFFLIKLEWGGRVRRIETYGESTR